MRIRARYWISASNVETKLCVVNRTLDGILLGVRERRNKLAKGLGGASGVLRLLEQDALC